MTAGQVPAPDADPLAAALTYAARGLRVLPILPGAKRPPMAAWQDAATTDPDTITSWFTGLYRDHGVGIATGPASGVWALDVDDYEAYRALEQANEPLPDTLTNLTGSGGMHFLYRYPTDGRTVRNNAGTRLGAGLDVRGDGGQIVAPPTVHPNGKRYEWDAGQGDDIVDAPGWLLELVCDAAPAPARITLPDPQLTDHVRPGDALDQVDWADLLGADGWTLAHTDRRTGERHWTRPGKDTREGTSATTGYTPNDNLKVFTSSMQHAGLQPEETYTKLGYWAATRHHGDHQAAAADLRQRGYGTPALTVVREPEPTPWDTPTLPAEPVPPPFPLASLPAWAQEHAQAAAEQVQVPVDLTAMLVIGSLAAAVTGRATVQVSPNWAEPVNLYLVTAMRSGSGKSAAEKLCCGWLRTWQADRLAQAIDDYELARRVAKVAEKRANEVEKSMIMGNKTADDLRHALTELQAARDAVPQLPRLLADDATPEAVANLLAAHGERLAIMSTEADLFDMVLKGKPGQRANLNVYLKAWSGDQMIRDRKGGTETGPESTTLERPLMTISVTVQPSVLRRLFADDEMVSRGFAARFMFSLPEDLIGRRDQGRRFDGGQLVGRATYETTATALADTWASWKHPAPIHLERDAAQALRTFLVELEPHLAAGARHERLGEWVNKLHGSIARYAGLLHLAEHHGPSTPIDADTMARAIDLGRYWLDTAAIVMGHDQGAEEQALALLEFMAGDGRAEFKLRDLQQGVRRPGIGLDKAADYVPAIEFLVDNGWLRPSMPDWQASVGIQRRESGTFSLWPEAIGQPLAVVNARKARCASMGERGLSSPPPSAETPHPTPYEHAPRALRAPDADPTPVDNPSIRPPLDLSEF